MNSVVRSPALLALLVVALAAHMAAAFLLPASAPAAARHAAVKQQQPRALSTASTAPTNPLRLAAAADGDEPEYDAAARAKIEDVIKGNKIVLFMKGTRLFPSCGFSNTAVRILDQLQVEYATVDVLADERIRAEIKRYSAWPTIPQLYLQGEFVGGSDIMLEMYQSGELLEAIEIAAAS